MAKPPKITDASVDVPAEAAASVAGAPVDASATAAASFADGHVDAVAAPLAIPAATLAEVEADAERARLRTLQVDPYATVAGMLGAYPAPDAAGFILIVCGTPGFRRGGIAHPSRAQYPLDYFTEAQLSAIRAEPRLEMVVYGGEPIARPDYGLDAAPARTIDPLLAGRAAADAVSEPPNRAEPGLRNAVADTAVGVRGL